MTQILRITPDKIFTGRLRRGSDLLEAVTEICVREKIRLGRVEAIGAVQKARIGFYNQKTRAYEFLEFSRPMEITSLMGNISIKDEKPFVHAHVNLADDKGRVFGGHLAPGTVVFACEIIMEAFDGPVFERIFDEETGLALWEAGR